ncbi:MAG: hypothetical protein K5663_12875 [Clostridiales bacterium]|nr:hypothetical protein [Clostridiales bacterium]
MLITSKCKLLAAFLVLVLAFMSFSALAEEGTAPDLSASVTVRVQVLGTAPQPAETYRIVLTADDKSYPMPAGSSNGEYTLRITGSATRDLPEIKFTEMGVYTYTIRQLRGNAQTAISYDRRVYNLTIAVYRDGNNQFYIVEILREAGSQQKLDMCLFQNRYSEEYFIDPPTPLGFSAYINIGDCFE